MQPSKTLQEAQDIVNTKTAPRVTQASIEERIDTVNYLPVDTLTICMITMKNGFRVLGKSAPASPENYDPEVGQRYAYEDAFKQLWQFEGYLLCERLTEAA